MSFILEALKKSENKRRKKSGQISRTIHEPSPRNNTKSRLWVLGILLLLVVNAVLLLWFFGPSKQPDLAVDTAQVEADMGQFTLPQPATSTTQNDAGQLSVLTQNQHQDEAVKALQVPRNDKQVYRLGQLPISIQKQIPTLQMSLHAYNRDDASASMVQLNDRIMREGDRVTDNMNLEKIEADGIVLRYDGYRIFLPRRGN
ncbi:MAG: general secretion pathway protein GspB [Desulfuromusa sp.]|nr:general secretion pathway protein GspB [Desulfuromusa sp.]